MRKADKVMEELEIYREDYEKLIDSRMALFNAGGVEALKQDNDRFKRREDQLLTKMNRLKLILANLDENWRFTERRKHHGGYSKFGDNGYLFCHKCKNFFKVDPQYSEEIESVRCCEDHATMKKRLQMEWLMKEELPTHIGSCSSRISNKVFLTIE